MYQCSETPLIHSLIRSSNNVAMHSLRSSNNPKSPVWAVRTPVCEWPALRWQCSTTTSMHVLWLSNKCSDVAWRRVVQKTYICTFVQIYTRRMSASPCNLYTWWFVSIDWWLIINMQIFVQALKNLCTSCGVKQALQSSQFVHLMIGVNWLMIDNKDVKWKSYICTSIKNSCTNCGVKQAESRVKQASFARRWMSASPRNLHTWFRKHWKKWGKTSSFARRRMSASPRNGNPARLLNLSKCPLYPHNHCYRPSSFGFGPFGPAFKLPSSDFLTSSFSGTQAVWPMQCCGDWIVR